MILPIVLKTKEDEILYSYLLRLSQANGFDDLRDFLGTARILPLYENPKSAYRTVRYDIHSDLYPLLKAAALPLTDAAELYRKTSLFPIWSLTCGRALASHRIGMLSKYRSRTNLITPLADIFQELKFCQQCREQDLNEMGEWYYRRSHQIPGVAVCHRHGSALHLYQGKRGSELDPDQPSTEMNVQEKSLEYAVLAHELLIADLSYDVESIAKAILSQIKERGYSKQTVERLQKDMGSYATLLNTSLKSFFRYFPPKSQCDMQTCLALIRFLFRDVNTLLAYLPKNTRVPDKKQMDEKYELMSPGRKNLIELRCRSCHHCFLTTPHRIQSGWGCPDCDTKLSDQELFQHIFDTVACGDYELLSFLDMNHRITIRHHACGRAYSIRARSFLEESARCACGKVSSREELYRRIDLLGNFELIDFQNTKKPLRILHPECGSEFTVNYSRFIRHPNCTRCASLARSEQEFRDEIYGLVGDEYELIGVYKGRKTDVQILHKTCNTVQTYKPQRFLMGTRCAKCHHRLIYSDFSRIVSEASYGVYAIDRQIGEYDALIRNTQTGETRKLPIVRIMQELFRFKPSTILSLKKRNLNVSLTPMVSRRVMEWLSECYAPGEAFSIRRIDLPGMEHQQLSKTVQNLYRANKLEKISYGVYMIPPEREK